MKIGKRMLALMLVLAMLVSNLPVGAIAAEYESLLPEPTEALTETEQMEDAVEETTETPPETSEEPETEGSAETTEAPEGETGETVLVEEEQTAAEEAVDETAAAEEYPAFLSVAPIREDEDGLYVSGDEFTTDYVNPYGREDRVAFFLNEFDGENWIATSVEVEALDDSISLELGEEYVRGAEWYYHITTNVPDVTSGVAYGDVTMNIGTWPHHFHFTTEANTQNDNTGLIYELNADHLMTDTSSVTFYAAMFHDELVWSDVALSGYSDFFADIDYVADDLYMITLYGEARKYVQDNGIVYLEVMGTATDKNSGEVMDSYLSMPVFLAPNPGLTVANLVEDGDGLLYESEDHSYMFRVVPGNVVHQMYYLRQWDYELGEMTVSPVAVDRLRVAGDMTFTQISSDRIREGEPNAEYFAEVTTGTWGQSTEVYIELEDGRTAGGVNAYTDMGDMAFFSGTVMQESDYLREYTVVPGQENVFYFIADEDYSWNPFTIDVPAELVDESRDWADLEDLGNGVYKITLREETVDAICRGDSRWMVLKLTITRERTGFTDVYYTGINLRTDEANLLPYLTWGWLEGSDEGLYEGEWNDNTSFDIVPGDAYCFIFYVHVWDAEQECYVAYPVAAEDLYCDNGNFGIEKIRPEDCREGEPNVDSFVWITAEEWDHEGEIFTFVNDVQSQGVRATTYLPQLGFYSQDRMDYDTFIREYTVDPEAEENAFYVGLYADYWVISGEPWLPDETDASRMRLEKISDNMIKVILNQEAIDAVVSGEELWPTIAFDIQNTEDENWIDTMYAGGMRVRGLPMPYMSYSWMVGDDSGLFEGEWYDERGFSMIPGDGFLHTYYLHTWDESQGDYVRTAIAVEDLYCDDDTFTIEPVTEDIREGEPNAHAFAWIGASEWGHETEIYTLLDGVRVTGVYVSTFLPEAGYYSSEDMSYDTFIREFVVDPDAEENAFYVGIANESTIDGDPWLAEEDADQFAVEKIDDKLIKVTLTEAGMEAALNGRELWPRVFFGLRHEDDSVSDYEMGGLMVRADAADVIPEDQGLRFRFLEDEGEGAFDPGYENCYGSNLAKGDEYLMYFFLNLWDAQQGQYIEIPVHPEHSAGITMTHRDAREGEENGEYYYAVSVTEFDADMEVWLDYSGKPYSMPITSYLHTFDLYTEENPSHDSRILGPVDMEPFGENVVYAAYSGEGWTVLDMYAADWCSDLVDLEQLTETVWKVTLNDSGINENMSQWHLPVSICADLQNDEDPEWTEFHEKTIAFSREHLETLAFFQLDGEDYEVIDGGYIHSWPTGEFDQDEEGNTWEIWDSEVLTDLPGGLSYDIATNTLTMDNYDGERMAFEYAWEDWETGDTYYNLPSDTLTVELIGSNALIVENEHAFQAGSGLNVNFTGDGDLYLRTDNDHAFRDGYARVFNTVDIHGGNLTVSGDARVTVEAAGEGNEAVWMDDAYIGVDQPGHINAIWMEGGVITVQDNAALTTVVPDGAARNGDPIPEGEPVYDDNRCPGGYEGLAGYSKIHVYGGSLNTQSLNFWGESLTDDSLVQTGGEINVAAQAWKNFNEEGALHYHYEGISLGAGVTADISGGVLNVNVEIPAEELEESVYYNAVAVSGGELKISGDAEVTISANCDRGDLLAVRHDFRETGLVQGKLSVRGGTLNVSGEDRDGRSGIYLEGETVLTVSGGIINSWYADIVNHGVAHISGGEINVGGQYLYEENPEWAWITGFTAGGPSFVIDGGVIYMQGGTFTASGMVTMNGGELAIMGGALEVATGFAFNDGQITISNSETELTEHGHKWPSLWIGNYMSIGGAGKNPVLNIDHGIDTDAVMVKGTYHQMEGSTVNIVTGNTESAAISVVTQFDENGNPMVATDENGDPILGENDEPILLTGRFLMNDGELNITNPGGPDAELIKAMWADPCTFVQFLGGVTSVNTGRLFWNGEAHIGGEALLELYDTALITNDGNLVMDGGTLRATEESAIMLGMAEMNGGLMYLNNGMILVNGGFHFNNGEIVIDNTDENILTDRVFTSIAANTYFAIGNPEDPASNPSLIINHNLTRCPAVMVNGTMHLMAGTVELNIPVTKAPAISVSGPIYDDNGVPVKTDEAGNPVGGEILQNGGVLNINATEQESMAGIISAADSVIFMNGGEMNLNGTNLVMSGKLFLYDTASLNVYDGVIRLYDTAIAEIDHGTLTLDTNVYSGDDVPGAFYSDPGSQLILKQGAVNVTSGSESYEVAMQLDGSFRMMDGQLNIQAPGTGLLVNDNADIYGGSVNITVGGVILDDGVLVAAGLQTGSNAAAAVRIHGGEHFLEVPQGGQHDAVCYALNSKGMPIVVLGGTVHLDGQYVFFGKTVDGEDTLVLPENMVLYSLNTGERPELLSYSLGGTVVQMFENDNAPGDWDTGDGFDFVSSAVITTKTSGSNTAWNVSDGILTFQGNGDMYNFSEETPAPWYWLRDFITAAELDSNLSSIGSYAFGGLENLTCLTFLGEAPAIAEDAFAGVIADAFYPAGIPGWTTEKLQNYGGTIRWMLNQQSVEVVEILADKDVLFPGQAANLTARMYPEDEDAPNVVWTLEETPFATLTVKNNVATVIAKTVTETQYVTVYAVAEEGLAAPAAKVLTIYPKAQAVLLYNGETDVTGGKLTFDLVTGDELELTAALNPSDAEEYLDPAVTWTSSAEKIATVDEQGTVTFTGTAGTVKITATAADGSGKKATVTITAKELVQNIELLEGTADELLGGKSVTLTAVDADTGAKLKATQILWSVPEEFAPYAAISAKGKLTTKTVAEEVQITVVAVHAENPDASVTHVLTLRPAVTTLRLDENGEDVTGQTLFVDVDGYDEENLPTLVLNASAYPDGAFGDVTWKSSSTGIAKVEDGTVTGVWNSKTGMPKTGTVTITATSTDGSKKTASVKLNFGIFAQDVEITSTETEIVSGSSLTLTAETFPEKPTKAGVTWSLKNASDKNYLSVTAAGKVKAKTVYEPTDVVLVATSKDGCADAEMTLTVMPKDMGILVIRSGEDNVTKTTKILDLNGNATVTLAAHTLNGGQETVTWTPATSKLGTVTANADGTLTVTMTKAGSMTVKAQAADGRSATVTLKAVALATGVTVTQKGGTADNLTLAAGKTMTMQATLAGVAKGKVTWSVEPAGFATITSAGKLTAAAGLVDTQLITVTATTTDGGMVSGSAEVLLMPQIQAIQIHGEAGDVTNTTLIYDMAADPQLQLSAQTFPGNAADNVTWKSSGAKIATVDANGKVTCLKSGTVTITATAADGSGKKATFKLTVVKLVKQLTMEKTAVIAGGKSLTLKADAGDATNGSVTWSMTGDTAYATLSAKGVLKTSAVTAPKTVYVTATAKDGSGKTATCAVTIYPATTSVQVLYAGENVTGKTIEVPAGRTISLEGSSQPQNAADAYTWKSSGAAATVTAAGQVTGVTVGKTVTVTCTAADGSGKKASVKIKVTDAPVAASEISLWTYPVGSWGNATAVNKLVSAFEAETGIRVKVEYLSYTDGDVKVDTAIAAGAAPDLVMEGPERLVANWGKNGHMVNVADLFDENDKREIYSRVQDACFADASTAYMYPMAMTAHCMAINKTVFEAAGAMGYLDEKTHTWNSTEDFFAAVQAVYEYTGSYVGAVYCGGRGGDQGTRALVNNLRGGTFTNAAHTAYTWDSEQNIQALKDLYDCEGIVYDAGIAGGDEISLFYNGMLNMAFCWNISQQLNPSNSGTGAGKTANGDEILFMAFPAPDGNDVQLQGGIWGFGILDSGDEERVEAAKKFVKYFCDSEATAEAVATAGYFPVRSLSGSWTQDAVVEDYNCLMPMMGDYYQVTRNWNEARNAWVELLQRTAHSDGSLDAISQIVGECTARANGQ